MPGGEITTFGNAGREWHLPPDEAERQAIASLRGYAYQLHQSAAAWINLPDDGQLYLEIAEDYAQIVHAPERMNEVLQATQVKDTRYSGAVTLNSADVQSAIQHLFALQEANPARTVRLTFLTTSPIGKERKAPLRSGTAGLSAWHQAAAGGDVTELRQALLERFSEDPLGAFISTASDEDLRKRVLANLTFNCGTADWQSVEAANRAALASMREDVQATWDLAERAYDTLLAHILRTILTPGDRMLDRRKLMECFARATSVAMPSQTVVDLAAQFARQTKRTSEAGVDEQSLRELANALLDVSAPPSLIPLFPEAPEPVRRALAALANEQRTVAEEPPGGTRRSRHTVADLGRASHLHHIVEGLPGSGKTHALWCAAKVLLETTDIVPLFLTIGGLKSWGDVLSIVTDLKPGLDPPVILRDPRVCVCLDGWSEFAQGEYVSERARALRVLHGTRVIANSRRRDVSDTGFQAWVLEPLVPALVRETVQRALGASPPLEGNVVDLLRSPLVLSLFVLLGGGLISPGALLNHLQRHLARHLPEGFDSALSGAIGSMTLSGERSYARLITELRKRAATVGLQEPTRLLERLGTIFERSGIAFPIHDLYWSWLGGAGILQEDRTREAILSLDTRESLGLALQGGARPEPSRIADTAPRDAVLAAELDANLGQPAPGDPLPRQLDAMFADYRLSVRYRAALAGLRSGRAQYIRQALRVISAVREGELFPADLQEALKPADLYPHRGIIAEWLGSPGSQLMIDAIAMNGSAEWLPWLEQVVRGEQLKPALALSAAVACSGCIPDWGRPHLVELVKTAPWRLRPISERGTSLEFARWLADHYEDIVDVQTSGWIDVNRVLVSCGDDPIFQELLIRLPSMSPRAQELIGFAVVERGEPWVARFQRVAFAQEEAQHHHRLAETLSLDIDDATARHWIELGHDQLGWRVLVARHGSKILPELVAGLPASFDNIHHVPTLAAMRYLEDASENLIDEIWSRVRGVMQPKAMQDALTALSKVKPLGMASIVRFVIDRPEVLSGYHLAQVVELYAEWQQRFGMDVQIQTTVGPLSFRDWALLGQARTNWDDYFLPRGLATAPELSIELVLRDFAQNDERAKAILKELKPLGRFCPELFERMIGCPVLAPLATMVFGEALDTFTIDALRQMLLSPHVDQNELLWRLGSTSNPLHRSVHLDLIERVLEAEVNLHHYRYIGNMLRAYSREEVLVILEPVLDRCDDPALWFVREVETARRERLIDEAGEPLRGHLL